MLYEKEIGSRDFCGGILYYVCYGNGLGREVYSSGTGDL